MSSPFLTEPLNRLTRLPQPDLQTQRSPIPVGWGLFGLVVLCLIPRALMAWSTQSVCQDGYYYLSVAAQCEHGHWSEAFSYLDLNVFPLILLSLNLVGLKSLAAAKAWSVVISSLAVLPLFGWVRRLFPIEIAWAAGFLYSVHAEFVEFSLEPVRDPTFWFLFQLTIYLFLRAITELRFRWFVAGGLALAFAIHTRSEGWLLIIPLLGWAAVRLRSSETLSFANRRLMAGLVCALLVTPTLIVLTNVTVLRGESEWKIGRLAHFETGWQWLSDRIFPANQAISNPASPSLTDTSAAKNAGFAIAETTRKPAKISEFLRKMLSALEPINCALLVFGVVWCRHVFWTWERGVLLGLAAALTGVVWILYQQTGVLAERYFFPVYLVLVPYFAIGFLWVARGLWAGTTRWAESPRRFPIVAAAMLILAIGLGWGDALTSHHASREREAQFGARLDEEYGPFRYVVTDLKSTRAGYHAGDQVPGVLHHWGAIEWQFPDQPYDLLLLDRDTTPAEHIPEIQAAASRLGLTEISLADDAFAQERYLAFARR